MLQGARSLAKRVRASHVAEMASSMAVDLREVAKDLADGACTSFEGLQGQVQAACKAAIDMYMEQQGDEGAACQMSLETVTEQTRGGSKEPFLINCMRRGIQVDAMHDQDIIHCCAGIRRGKLAASLEQFVSQVTSAAESLLEAMAREEPDAAQQSEYVAVSVPQSVPMPRCILANTEPYMHGDWRREPYLPRYSAVQPHPQRVPTINCVKQMLTLLWTCFTCSSL